MNEINAWAGVPMEKLEAAYEKGYLTEAEYTEAKSMVVHQSAKCKVCGNDLKGEMSATRNGWLHVDGMDRFAEVGLHTAFPKPGTIKITEIL